MLPKKHTAASVEALPFTGERYTPEIGGSIELEHLHRYLLASQVAQGKTVLDIACGEGYGSAMLARTAQQVFGVDIAPDAVEHAQKRYAADNLEFRVGSCVAIPLEDASVDVVVSFETLEHHDEHNAMMREVKRVLRPGGLLIISSPNKLECTDKPGRTNPHHVKELYRDEFVALLHGHFTHHRIYGQRVLYGSAILCEEGQTRITCYDAADTTYAGEKGLPCPMFFLALASDAKLPALKCGMLEQAWDTVEEIVIMKAQIAALEVSAYSLPYRILRKIYRRYAFLQKLRMACRASKKAIKESSLAPWSSFDNVPCLQAMAARRFNDEAVRTAIPVAHVDTWPEIDVSVVVYNSARWLEGFFRSLLSQRYPLAKIHLYVVDHGSSDGSQASVRAFLGEHGKAFASTLLLEQENLGYGAGHDRAIREGKSPYCLVTNVDLEFAPDALCSVVRTALADTRGIAASWELRQSPVEHPKHYDPVTLETAWSAHACILMRRSAYEKTGGYDKAIFMYAEDVELSYRFRSFGYVLKYVPSANVTHYAYSDDHAVKPMQYAGSMIGNMYIRMRYGGLCDIIGGMLLYARLFILPQPFVGSKRMLSANALKLLPKLWGIRRKKGPVPAYFPFRGFDYAMTREGALHEVPPLPFPLEEAPTVSVLIRTYKGRDFLLRQALQSVFNQTWPAIEIIVSEDGGSALLDVVEDMKARLPEGYSIRHLANPKNGRSATGNAALEAVTAPFFMFFDDDDLLYADHIELLMRALSANPECPVAYALGTEVFTNVDIAGKTYTETSFATMECLRQKWDYACMLHHNFMLIHALCKRELYETRGGLDTKLKMLEDWNLWIRYGCGHRFAYVPKTTSWFRSPAKSQNYAQREQEIHQAYDTVKERAIAALRQLGLM